MRENQIQQEAILQISKELSQILTIWRNNTGAAEVKGRFVRFGLPGQADCSGILAPLGRRVEIEFKSPGKKPSEDQKAFRKMIEKHGGLYFLVDSLEKVPNVILALRTRYVSDLYVRWEDNIMTIEANKMLLDLRGGND